MSISRSIGGFLFCLTVVGCVHQDPQLSAVEIARPVKKPCFGVAAKSSYQVSVVCSPQVVQQIAQLSRETELEPYDEADAAKMFAEYVRGMKILINCKNQLVFSLEVQDQLWSTWQRYYAQTATKGDAYDCTLERAALESLVPATGGR